MVLSGYQIPKDTFVVRFGYKTSNGAEYFKDPEIFMPERWMRGINTHTFYN